MKKLLNKRVFALVLCLVLALTAMLTVTAFADTEPADSTAATQEEETSAGSATNGKAIASGIAIGIAAAGGAAHTIAHDRKHSTVKHSNTSAVLIFRALVPYICVSIDHHSLLPSFHRKTRAETP